MNCLRDETKKLIEELLALIEGSSVDVVLCVPFTNLELAVELTKNSNVKIGAQTCHHKNFGAYTGEVSANMLKDVGVEYVILGHSERRALFGFEEANSRTNLSVIAALEVGLKPIICVGEKLEQKQCKVTEEIIVIQVKTALKDVDEKLVENIMFAYEPIWAIGSGKTATAEEADSACGVVRKSVGSLFGKDVAEKMRILYGGSVTADSCSSLFSGCNVDGGLVGGASLKAAEFSKIVNLAEKVN